MDAQVQDIFFGPFSAGLGAFPSNLGAGWRGYIQLAGGGSGGGDGDIGGDAIGIGDDDDGPPTIDGDAMDGGDASELGDIQ